MNFFSWQKIRVVVLAASAGIFVAAVSSAAGPGQFMAFATENQAFMGIGRYQPDKGWAPYQLATDAPEPGDLFTIYTMDGKVAQVKNLDHFESNKRLTPAEWSAPISPWYREGSGEPYGVAIHGDSPVAAAAARSLPLDDPALIKRVASYLKKRHLNVPRPFLTQAYEITLKPGDPPAILVTAHSDASALRDNQAAAIYAIALLEVPEKGSWKDFALSVKTSFKPAFRSIEEHEQLFGKRPFYRFVSCLDIDADSRQEIVLYSAQPQFGTEISVYGFDGSQLRQHLSAFKHLYD
jgi:hypothetical protein